MVDNPIDCPFCREKEAEIARLKNEIEMMRLNARTLRARLHWRGDPFEWENAVVANKVPEQK
jgi:hypothetical protein